MIAFLHVGHFGANLLNDASRFMPDDRRQRMREQSFHEMKVRVAKSRALGADQYFVRAGFLDTHILDHQRLIRFVKYGSFHGGGSPGFDRE